MYKQQQGCCSWHLGFPTSGRCGQASSFCGIFQEIAVVPRNARLIQLFLGRFFLHGLNIFLQSHYFHRKTTYKALTNRSSVTAGRAMTSLNFK